MRNRRRGSAAGGTGGGVLRTVSAAGLRVSQGGGDPSGHCATRSVTAAQPSSAEMARRVDDSMIRNYDRCDAGVSARYRPNEAACAAPAPGLSGAGDVARFAAAHVALIFVPG